MSGLISNFIIELADTAAYIGKILPALMDGTWVMFQLFCWTLVLSLPLGSRSGLLGLSSLSCNQLQQIRGIGEVKAVRICCIFELARRIALGQRKKLPAFPDPGTAADYCRPIFEEDGGMLERTILLLLDQGKASLDWDH